MAPTMVTCLHCSLRPPAVKPRLEEDISLVCRTLPPSKTRPMSRLCHQKSNSGHQHPPCQMAPITLRSQQLRQWASMRLSIQICRSRSHHRLYSTQVATFHLIQTNTDTNLNSLSYPFSLLILQIKNLTRGIIYHSRSPLLVEWMTL